MSMLRPPLIRTRDAFALNRTRLTRDTPVQNLTATELATVRVDLEPAHDIHPDTIDIIEVLALRLHTWAEWPDRSLRTLNFGNACAEHFAAILSLWDTRPLSVWYGWDALLHLDSDQDLGVVVTVGMPNGSRLRLHERVAQ